MNQQESERLYEEARPAILFMVKKMKRDGVDFDEVISEVWLSRKFKEAKKKDWPSAIKWAILNYYDKLDTKTRTGRKLNPARRAVEHPSNLESIEYAGVTAEDKGCEEVDNRDFYEAAIGSLEGLQKVVMEAVANGEAVQDIAKRLGMTRQKVSYIKKNAIEFLRRRFKSSK